MPTSDKKLIDQYCKRQKIKKANAELSDNRIYQKIKEDINNDESAPFEHVLQIDDSLKDIDITARKFDIDYDIVHNHFYHRYYYEVIFNSYHKYQSKRYRQMQQFVNQELREDENWLTIVELSGILFTFVLTMIAISPFLSIVGESCWLIAAGLVAIISIISSHNTFKKIKQLSAELPAKASDIKL